VRSLKLRNLHPLIRNISTLDAGAGQKSSGTTGAFFLVSSFPPLFLTDNALPADFDSSLFLQGTFTRAAHFAQRRERQCCADRDGLQGATFPHHFSPLCCLTSQLLPGESPYNTLLPLSPAVPLQRRRRRKMSRRLAGSIQRARERIIFNSDGFCSLPPSFLPPSPSSHPGPPSCSLT
jgi:hypothetical protein